MFESEARFMRKHSISNILYLVLILCVEQVSGMRLYSLYASLERNGTKVLNASSGAQKSEFIAWFHPPKTATSFGAVIMHYANRSLPDNVDDAYALGYLAIGITDWNKSTDVCELTSIL